MSTSPLIHAKRFTAFMLMACMLVLSSHGGGSSSFSLSPGTDLAIGLPALALFGASMAVEPRAGGDDLGWFDEKLAFPYSRSLERAGTLSLAAGTLALPFLLDSLDTTNLLTLGVMFSQATLLTTGSKDLLKGAVSRPRPYLSRDDTPGSLLADDDAYASFPSGHASLAFMTAAFCTSVYAQGNNSGASKWLIGISTFCLASATSAMRVAGGSHYLTDVVAGAVLGSVIGVGVPFIHRKDKPEGIDINIQPLALSLTLAY